MSTRRLTDDERRRYSRHLILPELGEEGQERLKASSVLIVGAGGLGSPAGLYLAAAGVGRIGVADGDAVDLSNLQRQVLYATEDVGRRKAVAAAARLRELNASVAIDAHPVRVDASNAAELVSSYDLVIDATDNFPARYLLNDACVLGGKPLVYGAILQFHGQVSLFAPGGPCYRCLFPVAPAPGTVPSCAEGGVLGILPGIVGTLQATEALKQLLGLGRSLVGRLLLYDALETRFRELEIARDPACPVCGDAPTIRALSDEPSACAAGTIGASALRALLAGEPALQLVDVRTPEEWAAGHIDGAVLLPLGELETRIGELDAGRTLVVYCASGGRSAAAAAMLAAKGFTGVLNLEGGIAAWKAAAGITSSRASSSR